MASVPLGSSLFLVGQKKKGRKIQQHCNYMYKVQHLLRDLEASKLCMNDHLGSAQVRNMGQSTARHK